MIKPVARGLLLVVFLILTAIYNLQPTFAVDSTESARLDASIESQRASPSASMQTKLKKLQEEIASKASEFKAEVSGKLQNKAYVGQVKSKSEDFLILMIRGSDKTVKINEFTEFIFIPKITSKTKPSIKNLEAENYIVALGDADESEILTAKKIFKIAPPQDVKQIFFGEVLAVNENMITLKTDKNLAVSTGNQTIFKTGKEDGNLNEIKIGQKIIVTGVEKNKIIKASLIYTFSPGVNIKIKTASSSAAKIK